ncbi:cytochrome ubiquinol oxidase subunit I [Spiractinospora alimapuensis]|uniref:cytochrome ubiquinol oxidase subunit I n=1 Tax=Spiractinospora alimapuensis TaxID=2820884 RepID=UPI001F2FB8A1|nr:cytochrome ubiquinol oxidase subunit I [Spiractinospora alimapuensis]QVQ54764.1 cytochrome ubiquinol oxidase subunit I [Spiractinospora alimapuensis]
MLPDPLDLARLQFALTAATHYLFVALTLGMAAIILFSQLRATVTRDEARLRAVRFWGGLYVINYGMGILSGLVMELQLAVNWAGLHHTFGNVFGAPIAVETLVAFFLESTFLALWIFGWDRMNRWAHLGVFAVVTVTAYASAYWVLVANGFLKYPVGFEMVDGVAVLTDTAALLTNPLTLTAFFHIGFSALMVGGVFVAGVSAYHLRRGNDPDGMFRRGIRVGLVLTVLASFPTLTFGGMQFPLVFGDPSPTSGTTLSPAEIAAIEGASSDSALGAVAREQMMTVWMIVSLVAMIGLVQWLLRRLDRARWFHVVVIWTIPFVLLAGVLGWTARELGRQPWVVVHHLTTADAVTDMPTAGLVVSFTLFTVAFAVLATVTYRLIAHYARLGPEGGPLAPRSAADDHPHEPAAPVY